MEDENGTARVVRIGRDIRWEREGQTIEPRLLPEHRFLSCYTLEIDALMAASATEEEIGESIQALRDRIAELEADCCSCEPKE